ncbi:MAG: aspartate 1-decarboxylase [Candidatus Marinimicrobia bacterium]|nr:aspartate 1-decarboxylase [Candidatus Neomarinimicrobiota bacterium]MCK9559641.1 aspartate 1-decarboxylase [Candidatus Neomarinimicrobiota bacterium]MDD5061172.1 aspartate 1-decarboxylase [Candidatus Neomarinimicrobiota bacterium]MDD5541183.1 aspartate 1-decarboxylase [Candidatus Neomarinimicrobiota bacterium]
MSSLIMLKSKIHDARVTATKLDYEGSIEMDVELIRLANLRVFEKVQVLNINSGARFETYVIEGKAGQREISLNGAAARLVEIGDRVIILSYAVVTPDELTAWRPTIIRLDSKNNPL